MGKIEFAGSNNDLLAARLDMPDGPPRAFAIFAHCFTCSKDSFAAARISRALTIDGIAVLRFDFTGLGSSDGEFANTGFSSNVEDLVKAADFLRQTHLAPQLLIGHSFGGAAVLAAAHKIAEVKAIVTIGAPSHAAHVLKNIDADLTKFDDRASLPVKIAGREFDLSKGFVEDITCDDFEKNIKNLKTPLLIFHAPFDEIVSIDNATDIFIAARHPKSFVSLDNADHLLTDRADAVYVAEVTSAWSSRYLDDSIAKPTPGHMHTVLNVSETGASRFQQKVSIGRHNFFADEPASVGGADTGPSPYDFLSAALGACTTMTLRMYADHKGYDVGKLSVDVSYAKVHADDCADCGEGKTGRIDRFERSIKVAGNPSPELKQKLLKIADRCPVHKTLLHSSVVATRMDD